MSEDVESQTNQPGQTDCPFPQAQSLQHKPEPLPHVVLGCHLVTDLGHAGCTWPVQEVSECSAEGA